MENKKRKLEFIKSEVKEILVHFEDMISCYWKTKDVFFWYQDKYKASEISEELNNMFDSLENFYTSIEDTSNVLYDNINKIIEKREKNINHIITDYIPAWDSDFDEYYKDKIDFEEIEKSPLDAEEEDEEDE